MEPEYTTVDDYKGNALYWFDRAGECGIVIVCDENGKEVMRIDRRALPKDDD